MKKILLVILFIIIICIVGVCIYLKINFNSSNSETQNDNFEQSSLNVTTENETVQENNANNVQSEETINNNDKEIEEMKIKLSFNDEEIYVNLDNNQSAKEFYNMLPMTVTFEDYNNTEKIAYLDEKLNTDDAPSGYDPEIGDFSYYAPWGNLSIFYKDFRYSNSLVKLGSIESGIDELENIENQTQIHIEKVN